MYIVYIVYISEGGLPLNTIIIRNKNRNCVSKMRTMDEFVLHFFIFHHKSSKIILLLCFILFYKLAARAYYIEVNIVAIHI